MRLSLLWCIKQTKLYNLVINLNVSRFPCGISYILCFMSVSLGHATGLRSSHRKTEVQSVSCVKPQRLTQRIGVLLKSEGHRPRNVTLCARSDPSQRIVMTATEESNIGLIGLAVMGQNLALNIAEKGFKISVYNRSSDKTDACVSRAQKEGLGGNLKGFKEMKDFVMSLERPRRVIILVKAGAPVDATIASLTEFMEPGDIIIDGGNEWYENTERRQAALREKEIIEIGMGVSGGEEGARRGPAMMPGGDADAYKYLAPIVEKVAAQTDDGACVTYIGPGGSGNFVKMVHNGIEYGDMQLIAEAYDVLKTVGGLSNEELAHVFDEWNKSELESFLIEITASIFKKKDEYADGFLVDKVLDKTGMKVCC